MGNGCTSIRAAQVVEAKSVLPKLKLVIVGESLSGKTCVAERFQKNSYQENYEPTKHVNIISIVKKVNVPNQGIVSVELWDVPGHEGVDLRKTYYLDADAVIVVIDLSDEDAYTSATQWKRDAMSHVRHTGNTTSHAQNDNNVVIRSAQVKPKVGAVPVLLLGNKFDVAKETFLRKQYSMCNGNSSKVTFSSYQASKRSQSNNNIDGLSTGSKPSVSSSTDKAMNNENEHKNTDVPPTIDKDDNEITKAPDAAVDTTPLEEDKVTAKEDIMAVADALPKEPSLEMKASESVNHLDNNKDLEKPDTVEEKMECDPPTKENEEKIKENEKEQPGSSSNDDISNETKNQKDEETKKEKERDEKENEAEEQNNITNNEEPLKENGEEHQSNPPEGPDALPDSSDEEKTSKLQTETVAKNDEAVIPVIPVVIEDAAAEEGLSNGKKESSFVEDSPVTEDNGDIPTQRKLKKIFPKDLIVKENGDIDKDKIEKKDSNKNLLEVNSELTESVSMISLLPPCVEQLESFAEENGFVAGIPVSAKDAKGGVHEAVQSLIRHVISKRRENLTERKRKTDEMSVRSRLSVSKRTRKTQNRSLTEDFEPLQEVGITEIDEVLTSCNSTLRDSEILSTAFREAIHDFKRECYSRKLIGGKQVSVEECVSALKEAVESSRVTSHEKNDIRLALLMRDNEPSFTLVDTKMNGFVNLQVTDENHEYISLASNNVDPLPLSADVVAVLKVYHDKVHPVCSEIMKRSSELELVLQQHFEQISSKEEKAWEMAVAAGHLQSNVRRILTGVAQGKARVRGTLEQIKETARVVGSTQTKIRAALLF